MKNDVRKNKRSDLVSIGFGLLLPGLLLTTILDTNRTLQVIGVLFLLASSAVFGASINAEARRKK